MTGFPEDALEDLVVRALAEDIGDGDRTTEAVVAPDVRLKGLVVAREPLVVAGVSVFHSVYRHLGDSEAIQDATEDGMVLEAGRVIASIQTDARRLLMGERVALNIAQRLSGIATLTRAFVDEVRGTGARILDTRKTTPTLRDLEKYAVKAGGGFNHRFGLFDAMLLKDNHIAAAGGISRAFRQARGVCSDGMRLQIEVDTIEQLREALDVGADMILLDNMTVKDVEFAVQIVEGRARLEVTGGVTLANVRGFAQTGVDDISVGALTHSARAVDIGLDVPSWK
jgi:nicotinate-nucleotide pyrophosphorylase (carboxylating)